MSERIGVREREEERGAGRAKENIGKVISDEEGRAREKVKGWKEEQTSDRE